MDVREKLVDLLDEAEEWADHKCDELDCEKCPAGKMKGNCVQLLMVDRLIAHGVTVQEWIPVTEQLPKTGERVLVCIGAVFEAFIDDAGKWQRYYSAPLNEVLGEPTHWMPLPEPPKEVE